MLAEPSVLTLFAVAAFMSAVSGLHTPALESLTPTLVPASDLSAVSALSSLQFTTAAIAGPALAGICIATLGLSFTFGMDAVSYAISLVALSSIRSLPAAQSARPAVSRAFWKDLDMRGAGLS
jgi:hypothetical protein